MGKRKEREEKSGSMEGNERGERRVKDGRCVEKLSRVGREGTSDEKRSAEEGMERKRRWREGGA